MKNSDQHSISSQLHQDFSIKQPIFLVGAERSGTTLFRLMLEHHPQVTWCNEFEYAVDLVSDDGEFPVLDNYYDWLSLHGIFQGTKFTIDTTFSYPELINDFLVQRLKRKGKPVVGATVHRHFDRLLYIWPNARFIHIVRDPRDVARSCVNMGWAGNVWKGVERWIEAEQLWGKISSHIPDQDKLEIQYDDLIRHTTVTLARVCDFLGVEYSDEMLTYPSRTDFQLPNPKLLNQWAGKLSNQEIQLIEGRIGSLLTDKGFVPSKLKPFEPGKFYRLWLEIQSWAYKLNFRIKRYGLILILLESLTRRLNLRFFHKKLKLNLSQKRIKTLKKSLTYDDPD